MIGPSAATGFAVGVSNVARRSAGVRGPGTCTWDAGRDRQVESLEDERRHAPRAGTPVVRRVRQDELVPRAGHRHVEQPAFLAEGRLGGRRLAAAKSGREGQRIAAAIAREPPGDEARQEDDRELEALRLVDGQDGDRVGIRVELGRGRVVAGLDERREMRRDEDRPVVAEQRRLRPDDLEEAGDVGQLLLGRGRVRRHEASEHAAGAQEAVQELARRPFMGVIRVAVQVCDELADRRPRLRTDPQDARLPVELVEHGPDGPVAAAGHVHDRGQVLAAEPVDVRCRDRVEVDVRLEVCGDPQERQQEAHLGSGVQPGGPGEAPRDAGHVERPQDRVGVAVRADEDGVVAGGGPGLDPTPDLGRDPVGLLGTRAEHLEPDRRGSRRDALGPEPLDDARPDLEPVRVVEPDEPVRGVEDRRERAVVPTQDDGPCPEISVLEGEDVVDRGTAERVDRLVVVPDHGHVAVLLGECRDELGLGAVGVLELVDEDVPEAVRDLAPRGRRRPHEAEGQRDLVAEIDAPGRGHQVLVGRVRPRQLGLPAGLLVDGRSASSPAASRTHAASAATRSAWAM